jgi:hypothetical protein
LVIADIVLTEALDPDLQERLRSGSPGLGGAITAEEHELILRRLSFAHVSALGRRILSAEELATIACYPAGSFSSPPDREDLLALEGKVASVTFIAMRPQLS